MKICIYVDQEGMPSVSSWGEVDRMSGEYQHFNNMATDVVVSACQGALLGGAKEVWVFDIHWTAQNIDPMKMPDNCKLVRGRSGSPCGTIEDLKDDVQFDCAAFVGYHSEKGSRHNPLCHTISNSKIDFIKINGEVVGEFEIDSKMTSCFGVKTVFVAGDAGLTNRYKDKIVTVATNRGIGGSTIALRSFDECKKLIQKELARAIKLSTKTKSALDFGGKVEMQIKFRQHQDAFRASFYPNAEMIDDTTIRIICDNFYELMRAKMFMI